MVKNRAVSGLTFLMINKNTGAPVTSGVVTGVESIDGAAQVALSGTITHLGGGQWKIDTITAAEMNGDIIGLLFTHADAIPVSYTIATTGELALVSGAGAIEWDYTLTESTTGNPIADAEIWVSTDAAGANVVATGTTDSTGKVTFELDAGTYYIWRRKTGYSFTPEPDVEVVS